MSRGMIGLRQASMRSAGRWAGRLRLTSARKTGLRRAGPRRLLARLALAAPVAGLGLGLMTGPALAAVPLMPTIAAGGFHSCSIQAGKAYCWGANYEGELGNDSFINSSIPVAVDSRGALAGKTLTQISAGVDHTCALASTGRAYCWGGAALGNGSTGISSVPVPVFTRGALAGKTLTQISADNGLTCALDSAGRAYCWGQGALGNGSTSSSVPVAVFTGGVLAGQTLTKISAASEVSTGGGFVCALGSTRKAYCWGDNSHGQLGNGGHAYSGLPSAVTTTGALAGKTLTQLSAGDGFACAVDSTGKAYCWGYNNNGQLGDGTTVSTTVPLPVATGGVLAGKALTQIGTGSGSTCALATTGKAYCWGHNDSGQLGNGTGKNSTVPVAVSTSGLLAGKALTQLTTSSYHTCTLDSAGAAYCWGDNTFGELGNNSHTGGTTPVLAGPSAPTRVTAKAGKASAAVSWTAPASLNGGTLIGYTATAKPGGRTCGTTTSTRCTITGLTSGTSYTITVVVNTTAGRSGASAAATVTPAS